MNFNRVIAVFLISFFINFVFAQSPQKVVTDCNFSIANCDKQNIFENIYGKSKSPFYALNFLIENEKCIIDSLGALEYYSLLSNYYMYNADYKNAQIAMSKYSFLDSVIGEIDKSKAKNYSFSPFYNSIKSICKNKDVVMLNEAHHYPRNRMVVHTMLDSLYDLGFRALALEALPNIPKLLKKFDEEKAVNVDWFSYTNEPIYNELISYAYKKGYHLIAYEDTISVKIDALQRDSFEAVNLYNRIKDLGKPKTLVLAGYGHICKKLVGEDRMMSNYFREISGLNVISIDQTNFICNPNTIYENKVYKFFKKKLKGIEPFVCNFNNNILQTECYDVSLFLPADKYILERPTWLLTGKYRKRTIINIPKSIRAKVAIVKAYYTQNRANVPIDQFPIINVMQKIHLYLPKGNFYVSFQDCNERELMGENRNVK